MSTVLDLLIAELRAYYDRESRIVQGLAFQVHGILDPGAKEQLRSAFNKHSRIKEETEQALRSLQYLRKAGFPLHLKTLVGPKVGIEISKLLNDILESQSVLDIRSDTIRAELVIG